MKLKLIQFVFLSIYILRCLGQENSNPGTLTSINNLDSTGKRNGIWEQVQGGEHSSNYFRIARGNYVHGKKNGYWIFYHPTNHFLFKDVLYEMDTLNGVMNIYIKKNKLRTTLNFKNGRLSGNAYFYCRFGKLALVLSLKGSLNDYQILYKLNKRIDVLKFIRFAEVYGDIY